MSSPESSFDFRRLFEVIPGSYIVLLPDLTVVAVSNDYLRVTMLRREDLVGKHLFQVFPENPDDGAAHGSVNVNDSIEKVFRTGEPDILPIQKYDLQRPAEEGGGFEERFWKIATFPLFDQTEKIAYVIHHVEDITERMRLEQKGIEQKKINAELEIRAKHIESERKTASDALEDARLRLETALEAGEIGTWTWDIINDRVVADDNFARIFSVSAEDAGGGKIENYLKSIHADDRERVGQLIAETLENGDSYEAEYRLLKPDNSARWVVARGRVLRDEEGNPVQLPGVVLDITGRKESEEALRESERRLKFTLDAGQLGSYELDFATGRMTCSETCLKNFGLPPEADFPFEKLLSMVENDDRERVKNAVANAVENHTDYKIEYRINRDDGRPAWIFAAGRCLYDDQNNASVMNGVTLDITASKQSQEQLVERTQLATLSSDIGIALNRSENLGNLLNHCANALVRHLEVAFARIWTLDKSGEILELQASSGLYTHLDGDHSRIRVGQYKIGKIAEERQPHLTNEVLEDSRVSNKEWAKRERMTAFAGYPLIVEDKLVGVMCVFARKPLTKAILEAMSSVSNTIANAIERKQIEENLSESNERFQLVTLATNDAIWDWNLQTNEVWWNNATQTMFGYAPEQVALTSKWWYEHIHPDDRERIVSGIRQVIENGGENWAEEYRFLCADGSYKYVFDRGFAIHRDHQPQRMIGAMQDITANKLIESEREQLLWSEKDARSEAENANRLKDEFLATLSHELRTPLSAILGWSRMLREKQLDQKQTQHAIETIERNAKSQSQLIEDILDVSRIISGKLRLEVRPVELGSIIETAIEAVRPAAEAKNIRLQRITDSGVMIAGDSDRLQQIIWNLLSNAIKFTPKEGRVQIKLERVNSHVEITVADDGIGIESETIPYIFERFRQSDSSTTRKHGGLGLGLAIVRHLVELHGGTVHAASGGENKGSVFTVTFPLIALRSKELEFEEEVKTERIHPTTDNETTFVCPNEIKNLRILLVDDEPDTREMLIFIFEYCGAQVKGVASVAQALDAIKAEEFDVLVSDIGMPERDGYDLIKHIRQLPPEHGGRIPAVALTAYARVEDRMRVLAAGFQMHVPKPVEPVELLAVVASLAEWNNRK